MISPIITDFEQLVDKIQTVLSTNDISAEHSYDSFITDVIMDVALVPIHRDTHNLEPLEEDDGELEVAMITIFQLISDKLNKPVITVKRDILKRMKSFPSRDVKMAAALKAKNHLH